MTERAECLVATELLQRLCGDEAREPTAEEMERASAHLESCQECGLCEPASAPLLEEVRNLDAALPTESAFAASAEQIMAAIRAEPEAGWLTGGRWKARVGVAESGRRPSGVSRGARPASRRRRLVGTVVALAAGIALILVVGPSPDRPLPRLQVAHVDVAPKIEVVSVGDVDPAELAASQDAWLLASYDIFALDIADSDWQVGRSDRR